jgi:hypothetical protein
MTLPLSEFLLRTPFAWLRERDIDLLVCSELYAKGELTRLLASRIAPKGAQFVGAYVSHAEADGESDMVVVFTTGDAHIIALIENKIAASFQCVALGNSCGGVARRHCALRSRRIYAPVGIEHF